MNLQQLNQSGQNIRSFLITVIVALCVTGLMWLCLALYNRIGKWIREDMEEYSMVYDDQGPLLRNILTGITRYAEK